MTVMGTVDPYTELLHQAGTETSFREWLTDYQNAKSIGNGIAHLSCRYTADLLASLLYTIIKEGRYRVGDAIILLQLALKNYPQKDLVLECIQQHLPLLKPVFEQFIFKDI